MKINNVMTVLVVSGLAGCALLPQGGHIAYSIPDCKPLVEYQGGAVKLSTTGSIKTGAAWNESKLREAATQLQLLDFSRIEYCKSVEMRASMNFSQNEYLIYVDRYEAQTRGVLFLLPSILASNDKDAPEKFQKTLQSIYEEYFVKISA